MQRTVLVPTPSQSQGSDDIFKSFQSNRQEQFVSMGMLTASYFVNAQFHVPTSDHCVVYEAFFELEILTHLWCQTYSEGLICSGDG
mmetsp:Transcript_34701/g.40168  ORF Transcript_34701/g.40168 Transcript_34701/m.40168 type:complete len:86 (-) Transcript_34701:116-373(-)